MARGVKVLSEPKLEPKLTKSVVEIYSTLQPKATDSGFFTTEKLKPVLISDLVGRWRRTSVRLAYLKIIPVLLNHDL